MTPADPRQQMPQGKAERTAAPKVPMRPEDVDRFRAEAKAAKAAEAHKAARAKAQHARAATQPVPAKAAPPAHGDSASAAPASTHREGRPAPARTGTGRTVRLTLARIDPWSALKMSFLLSVALGIAMVVAVAALWLVLKGMGAFDQVNNLVGSIIQDGEKKFDIMDFIGPGRVVSLSIVFAVIDVFLITAIATLTSFIYNVSAALVGGLGLTLTDD